MHRSRRRRIVATTLVGLGLVGLVGCIEGSGPDPEACAAPSVELSTELTADGMTPSDLAVCRDQEVEIAIDSEVDAVFHIHGYDAEVPATTVNAGETTTIAFTAARSGQFPIEVHPVDDPAGVEIGVLTVHER